MECYCYLRNVQDLLADGKTPCERRFGESFKGPVIPFGAVVEYHPISTRDQMRIHQFLEGSIAGNLSRICIDRGGLWKRDPDSRFGRLGNMDASEIYSRRINAKEVLIRQKGNDFIFPFADGTAKLPGRRCNELRVQLCVPKEEIFPIPLKYIDVTRDYTH